MGGQHSSRPESKSPSLATWRQPSLLAVLAVAALLATVLGMVALWPRGKPADVLGQVGVIRQTYEGEVTSAVSIACPGSAGGTLTCQEVRVILIEGPDEGRVVTIDYSASGARRALASGDGVVMGHQPEADPRFEYVFFERQRKPVLLWLALLFAGAVVLLGRLRGVAALAGLAASFVVLIQFVLPAILDGRSPILVSVVGSSAIAFLALYLAHGFGRLTTVALLGTLASLGLTALMATVFVDLADFTGSTSDEATLVTIGAGQIDLRGLVLGGVIIGALGAIDDVTVTQASAVWELGRSNPGMGAMALFRAGMRIGRDHVASTVNTLVLAYAGASMPLLLLFILTRQSLGTVANGEIVATEIVRTLVGSIGLVASVPLTTWLAARTVRPATEQIPPSRSRRRERRRETEPDDFWSPR
jgi:uncharacterized membrane protein